MVTGRGPWQKGPTLIGQFRFSRRSHALALAAAVVCVSVFSVHSQERDTRQAASPGGAQGLPLQRNDQDAGPTASPARDAQESSLWGHVISEVARKLASEEFDSAGTDDTARANETTAESTAMRSSRGQVGHSPKASSTSPTEEAEHPRPQADKPEPPPQKPEQAPDETEQSQVIKVGVNDRVTMHVAGLPLPDALRMLSEPSRRNIILADGASGTVTASLYNVTFDEALSAMLTSNGLGYVTKDDFVYVYPQEAIAKLLEAQRKVGSRIFKLTYINAAAAQSLIEPMLSNVGKVSVTPPAVVGLGGAQGIGDTKGDALASPDTILITDYLDRIEEIAKVLAQIDVHPKQVLIEATIMRATLNEDNALGIDFTTVGGIDFTELSSISPAAQSITTGNTPAAFLQDTTFTARTNLNSGVPAGGFTFGIIKDQIGVFIRALEQITDTDVMANPKVLALNKQAGQVIVGRRDGYLTTTITETTAVQKVEFLETGTVLTFRPFIGDDGYVRMEIHPKDSTGGLTESELPFEQTTEVTTNVLVQDGHTILIGGLFREVSTGTRGQVPLLGNLPIAGALFRRTRDTTVREEVIILLTVHILKEDLDCPASQELREDIERYRVGTRQGLQWFGRERIAQAHYRWALEHLRDGDLDKAIWDAQLAIHNHPRHIQAAKLKEKIINKRNWDGDASAVHTYVRDRIAEENGVTEPAFGRPAPPFVIPGEIEGPAGIEEDDGINESGADGQGDKAGVAEQRPLRPQSQQPGSVEEIGSTTR